MEGRALIVAVGGLLMTATIAMAQDTGSYPDMRGQWKGTTDTIVLGTGTHHRSDNTPGLPRMHNQELTLNIKGQEGRKFWGEIVSKDDRARRKIDLSRACDLDRGATCWLC